MGLGCACIVCLLGWQTWAFIQNEKHPAIPNWMIIKDYMEIHVNYSKDGKLGETIENSDHVSDPQNLKSRVHRKLEGAWQKSGYT